MIGSLRRASASTPTPSLRKRVTVMVMALFSVLMVTVGVVVSAGLDVMANRSLRERLTAAVERADALVALNASPEQLADQLNGSIVAALVVTADGKTYGDPAIKPDTGPGLSRRPTPLEPDDTAQVVVHPLAGGSRVILAADTTESAETIRQLNGLMIVAGAVTLLLTAFLLTVTSRAALAPLNRLAELARDTTTGDRGGRLRPDRAGTELGRAASAFDDMLDALEDSEKRAQRAADSAQRAEAALRRFLADAAHELRTPLAGIQAAAEQIVSNLGPEVTDGCEPAAQRQHHRAVLLLNETRRASRLVTDMLDLSYLDAGVPLQFRDTDLVRIVDQELERATLVAPRPTIERTGDASVPVCVDPTRVAQILSNLLENARRHTPLTGHIGVDVRCIVDADPQASQASHAVVTVTDTGVGIAPEDRERIFERLVRLDSARGRGGGGAGLGLPIAYALARAHGGDLTCLDSDGCGAAFRLTLPLRTPGPSGGSGEVSR